MQKETLGDPGAFVWDRWPSGWAIWCALDPEGPTPVSELVDIVGFVRATVYRSLDRLVAVGLARRTGSGWVRIERQTTALDFKRRADRRAKHSAERELHRRGLAACYARPGQDLPAPTLGVSRNPETGNT